jgi:hypothetical protein
MVGKRKSENSAASHLDSFLASIKGQLEGIGFSSDIVEQAFGQIKPEFEDNSAPDADEMFDSALSICRKLSPSALSSDDNGDDDEVLENKHIDEARLAALETAEAERIKRRDSRKVAWSSENILNEEDLDLKVSVVLLYLRPSDMLARWCKALSENDKPADSQRKSARLSTATSVTGVQEHLTTFTVPEADLRRFRIILAECLELEADVRKWYGVRSRHLFEDLGEKISALSTAFSRCGGVDGQHSAEHTLEFMKKVTEILAKDIDNMRQANPRPSPSPPRNASGFPCRTAAMEAHCCIIHSFERSARMSSAAPVLSSH